MLLINEQGQIFCRVGDHWVDPEKMVRRTSSKTGMASMCKKCKAKENAIYNETKRLPELMQELENAEVVAAQKLVIEDSRARYLAVSSNPRRYEEILTDLKQIIFMKMEARKGQYRRRILNVKRLKTRVKLLPGESEEEYVKRTMSL